MTEEILVNVTPREVRVALLDNGVLQEVHIERSLYHGLIGNIYKGKVNRVLPGIQAAFVDIGLERAGFLHIKDIHQSDHSDIRSLVRPGQELLVQVYKDQLGSKGARLTTQFTVPSRYLVFTPNAQQVAVSQRITDEAERTRLISMIASSDAGGYIFRTAAEGMIQDEVDREKLFLETLWKDLQERAIQIKPGNIVYTEIPIILRVLRDLVGHNIERIRVDHQPSVTEMRYFAERYMPTLLDRIEYYQGGHPIFDLYSVEDEIQKSLDRKVYLKSGGHLIIDQTEAMTTIDVNTGAYLGAANFEQTLFKTNIEAVEVIARQIRLRNLGGIIIIDFIDMHDDLHKEHLLQSLKNVLAKDSAKTHISELSTLGLVQLTRKRSRESLEHILCVACPICQRRGFIKSIETVSYEIIRELKRIAQIYPWNGFVVLAAEKIVNNLMEEGATILADLEVQLGKTIKLQVEPTFTQEQYNILPL